MSRKHTRGAGKELDPRRCHSRKHLACESPDPTDRMCLSKYLLFLMIRYNIRQQELVEKAGISAAGLSQILRGDTGARGETVGKLAQAITNDLHVEYRLQYYAASRAGFRLGPRYPVKGQGESCAHVLP